MYATCRSININIREMDWGVFQINLSLRPHITTSSCPSPVFAIPGAIQCYPCGTVGPVFGRDGIHIRNSLLRAIMPRLNTNHTSALPWLIWHWWNAAEVSKSQLPNYHEPINTNKMSCIKSYLFQIFLWCLFSLINSFRHSFFTLQVKLNIL